MEKEKMSYSQQDMLSRCKSSYDKYNKMLMMAADSRVSEQDKITFNQISKVYFEDIGFFCEKIEQTV